MLFAILTMTFMVPTFSSPEAKGPKTSKLLIHIYLNPDAENMDLEAGVLDLNDWPLTKYWIDRWNPEVAGGVNEDEKILKMMSYPESGMMLNDINNQRWPTGVTTPRDYDPASESYKHFLGTADPCPYLTGKTWDDIARYFRNAMAYLTNKDTYVSEILGGYGGRMDTMVPMPLYSGLTDYPALEAADHDLKSITGEGLIRHYNTQTAADILDYAGFVQGTHDNPYYDAATPGSAPKLRKDPRYDKDPMDPLVFYIRKDDPNRRKAGEMLRDQLRKAGIPVEDHIVERTVCYKQVMVLYDYHLYTGGWSLGRLPTWQYGLYDSAQYWGGSETDYYGGWGWSTNYPGYCSGGPHMPGDPTQPPPPGTYDDYGEKVYFAPTEAEILPNALLAQEVYARDLPLINWWATAAVKVYKTGWKGVVSMKGFGPDDNPYSGLNMYKADDDVIDWGFKSDLESIHVISAEWMWDWHVIERIYDVLFSADPYDLTNLAKDYGWLADSWTVEDWAPGKSAVTFDLRDDATFHDGSPFTPYDVAFSLMWLKDCGPGIAWNYDPSVVGAIMEVPSLPAHAAAHPHPDIVVNTGLAPNQVRIKLQVTSVYARFFANTYILNSKLWLAANDHFGWGFGTPDWDPVKEATKTGVREYHTWAQDVYNAGTGGPGSDGIEDLTQDGTGPWIYDGIEPGKTISTTTWISLLANTGATFYKTQAEISDHVIDSFAKVGNVNGPRSYFKDDYKARPNEPEGYFWDIDMRITALDAVFIVRGMGAKAGVHPVGIPYPGDDWPMWNQDCDFDEDTLIGTPDHMTWGKNYDVKTGEV